MAEEMAAPPAGPAQDQGGGATQLVTDISDKLMQFASMLDKGDVASPEEKQMMAQVVTTFQSLADSLMGEPGQGGEEPQPPGPVPEQTMGRAAIPHP